MPGHKGESFTGYEKYDLTEIDGADSLFEADGIIKESEENASRLFGCYTFYSTEGSSLSIRAMLCLATCGKKKPLILAGRNAHKTFLTTSALLDFDIKWIYPKGNCFTPFETNAKINSTWGFGVEGNEAASIDGSMEYSSYLSCNITARDVEQEILALSQKPVAVYLTSPDYSGNILDIESISVVCRKYGVLLLVDNAHGAYLKFLKPSIHPIDLGADMCCDSAHKTLPTLTGGGYFHIAESFAHKHICENICFHIDTNCSSGEDILHITEENPQNSKGKSNAETREYISSVVKECMSIFASTSPSYLILQSLDLTNKYLYNFSEKLSEYIPKVDNFKKHLSEMGYTLVGKEALKVTISGKSYGYTGAELGKILEKNNIYPEFYDKDILVMMFTPQTDCFEKLERVFSSIPERKAVPLIKAASQRGENVKATFAHPEMAMSPREALLSPKDLVSVENAIGRVLASPSVSCPPAVPIAVCGEIIDENIVEQFILYGIEKCFVVSQKQTKK